MCIRDRRNAHGHGAAPHVLQGAKPELVADDEGDEAQRHLCEDVYKRQLLMHSVMYRTEVLRECGMVLPKHTFYVDNIFVYQPLPYVKSMYYMDLDLYRYFIGRADQSVNESVMVGRVDQQLRVTKHMIDCQDLDALKDQKRLRAYMVHYLSVMMAVSDIFLLLDGSAEGY